MGQNINFHKFSKNSKKIRKLLKIEGVGGSRGSALINHILNFARRREVGCFRRKKNYDSTQRGPELFITIRIDGPLLDNILKSDFHHPPFKN